ncbi:MAG TPA: IS30 family transposase [Pseudonocardiaceae bacterium]
MGERFPREQVRVFWRARLAGASHEQAVARAGVSVTAGREWVYAAGGIVPGDVDGGCGRYLSLAEREEIALGRASGLSMRAIAVRLGRAPSTISRELRRNRTIRPTGRGRGSCSGIRYRARLAQIKAEERARRPKPRKLATNARLCACVQAGLEKRWSPEQISRVLRRRFAEAPEMWVSHETIYRELYVQGRGELRRELTRCLRTGRALRRPRRMPDQRGRRGIPDKLMISERPPEADDRAVPGHWEGDLILGKDGASAIGTLVERTTRFVMLLHLPQRHGAEAVRDAMTSAIHTLPAALRRSLTWDQGIEMARHAEITLATELPIYFCDPHCPWQRGSNENTNGLLRQYFPKGTDLSVHSAEHLSAVADELNSRPRKTLGWDTPAQALARLLAS